MGRKNLLQDLMDAPDAEVSEPLKPRQAKGAIGTVSRSIADLRSRSVTDLHPDQISEGGMRDRLEKNSGADAALVASMREYGQQVPVLVRPHPTDVDRYQIVYGRRRVAALQELGLPVKALIRDLDDKALIIAQGQENTARQDLSFIEKVNFARQMRDAGYDRKAMCAALHIDKTVISRMLKIADSVPVRLIEAIGSAPGIGRNRWVLLAEALAHPEVGIENLEEVAQAASAQNSDAAFEAVLKSLETTSASSRTSTTSSQDLKRVAKAPERPLKGAGGETLGVYSKASTGLCLTLTGADAFGEWLVDNIHHFHLQWTKEQDES